MFFKGEKSMVSHWKGGGGDEKIGPVSNTTVILKNLDCNRWQYKTQYKLEFTLNLVVDFKPQTIRHTIPK